MNHPNPLTVAAPFNIPVGTYRQLDVLEVTKRSKCILPLVRLLDQYGLHSAVALKTKVIPGIISDWKKSWHEALEQQAPNMALANRYLDELEVLERTVDRIK